MVQSFAWLNDEYMFLGITLNKKSDYFDLFIESDGDIIFIERNCETNENGNYIHIPFYGKKENIKYTAKDMSGNEIEILEYLFVK